MVLEALVGNKSVERILLFLLVNERVYATQVQKMVKSALTPIQKALFRLERGGILKSHYEGKTKIFTFNPHYPFLTSLVALLKDAYIQLPIHEKQAFSFIDHKLKEDHALAYTLWQKLKMVRRVTFTAMSLPKRKIVGTGVGAVEVVSEKDSLIFHEKGVVTSDQSFNFINVFRWSYQRYDALITLEHLRLGPKNPVFLFHLFPKKSQLESVHPHLCGKDTYMGILKNQQDKIILLCRIVGAKKNEEIEYCYS